MASVILVLQARECDSVVVASQPNLMAHRHLSQPSTV